MTNAFKNKRVLVVGLGKSGLAACRLLTRLKACVTLTDQAPKSKIRVQIRALPRSVRCQLGRRLFSQLPYDLIVVSPGVPWSHPSLVQARQHGIPVWPELELGWRLVAPRKTIAVTGTNGKTTTTAMIGHILKSARRPVVVAGNIGTPLSDQVSKISSKTFLVLEVSSYQLEAHETFHPDVAVFLNVTPDHLARHKTISNYARAKERLLVHTTPADAVVFNRRDVWCSRIARGATAQKYPFPEKSLLRLASHTPLRGRHNIENAMAAAAACRAVRLADRDIIRGIRSFRGVSHRIELVAKKKGVLYVNDSKGTNVDSTLVALKAFKEPIVLLMGGEHKGSSYRPLIAQIKRHVKMIVAYGEAKGLIQKDLKKPASLIVRDNLAQAVHHACQVAKPGDVVLLSPACASFDQYKNYEERGAHFVSLVKRLPG